MATRIESLFSTPLYCTIVENREKIQDEFFEVVNKLHFYDTHEMWGNPQKLTTRDFSDNVIEELNMSIVKKLIDDHLNIYLFNLGFQPKKIYKLTSWITSNSYGDHAPVHNHLDADISGVYYYQSNTKDGNIFFVTPALVMTNSVFGSLNNNYYISPEVGKLLMFPGWLQHGVSTNRTESNRKSLAFNIYFE